MNTAFPTYAGRLRLFDEHIVGTAAQAHVATQLDITVHRCYQPSIVERQVIEFAVLRQRERGCRLRYS